MAVRSSALRLRQKSNPLLTCAGYPLCRHQCIKSVFIQRFFVFWLCLQERLKSPQVSANTFLADYRKLCCSAVSFFFLMRQSSQQCGWFGQMLHKCQFKHKLSARMESFQAFFFFFPDLDQNVQFIDYSNLV